VIFRWFAGCILFGLACCISVPTHALNPDGFETFTHFGHIYAQTVVNTADGKPIWAEYNKQGGHTRLHELDGEVGQFLLCIRQSF